jgi:tetratricopeptide (TPR) repeat protein
MNIGKAGLSLTTALLAGGVTSAVAQDRSSNLSFEALKQIMEWNRSAEIDMNQGLYEQARQLYLRSLPAMEKVLGVKDASTITTLANLCVATGHLSGYVDAKPLCSRALALREEVLGSAHPDVARSLCDLGLQYAREGDFRRAESLMVRALRIVNRRQDSSVTPGVLNNVGYLYFNRGKYSLARNLFERATALMERARGGNDPDLVPILSNLGTVYLANHRAHSAEECFLRALLIAEGVTGPNHANSVQPLAGLARAALLQGRRAEAEMLLGRAESIARSNGSSYLEWKALLEAAHTAVFAH